VAATSGDPLAILHRFGRWSGHVPAGRVADFLGVQTDTRFWTRLERPGVEVTRVERPDLPALDEEIFEWLDLLEAVESATGVFRMVELGAGYGRWSVRGYAAATRRGLDVQLIAAEADASHFRMLEQHMTNNGIDAATTRLVPAAVAKSAGSSRFYTGHARDWYGQAMTRRTEAALPDRTEACIITVPTRPLSDLLEPGQIIDLIDVDIQGVELEVVTASLDLLTEQVRRVHIGTHPRNVPDVETQLRSLFASAGWRVRWDFAGGGVRETPLGPIDFDDGVQTWINPRLEDPR
jgi:FkbM family methyltransferase